MAAALTRRADQPPFGLRLRVAFATVLAAFLTLACGDPPTELHAGSWRELSGLPSEVGRTDGSVVWTGTSAIAWGGRTPVQSATGFGASLSIDQDIWRLVEPSPTSPSPRTTHSAVWSGSRMIIWGGRGCGAQFDPCGDGASYDPETGAWTPLSSNGAPAARGSHAAVLAGDNLLVWGGSVGGGVAANDGGAYRISSDTWSDLNQANAPSARIRPAAVWTGTELLIWGGESPDDPVMGDGGAYDPSTQSWRTIQVTGAPSARRNHTAIWTGKEMIVWGGVCSGERLCAEGAAYTPLTDTWRQLPRRGEPSRRTGHRAIWTGQEMIVWAGVESSGQSNDGAVYDPVRNQWSRLSVDQAPSPRTLHAAVATDNGMLIFGGLFGDLGLARRDVYLYELP